MGLKEVRISREKPVHGVGSWSELTPRKEISKFHGVTLLHGR